MAIRLIDRKWAQELEAAIRVDNRELRLISPFIKMSAIERLLQRGRGPRLIRVITRFSLNDFASGVSDMAALYRLLEAGASIRGIRNLHAKVYLFGARRAIVTSANLTEAGIVRNHEFGMVAEDHADVQACRAYFDHLWRRGGLSLTSARLTEWERTVNRERAAIARQGVRRKLKDHGVDLGYPPDPAPPQLEGGPSQAFVKFVGTTSNRADLTLDTFEEVKRAGCHWSVSYPPGKRPSSVEDGATIFIGRLTKNPNDIRVFGRATARKHRRGTDDATAQDIARRPWKRDWPHYLIVDDARFIQGPMQNGVSLNEMMDALQAASFAATQRNAENGEGNIDPRSAYRQKAHIMLSRQGTSWLEARLEQAFRTRGQIARSKLKTLDWPKRAAKGG